MAKIGTSAKDDPHKRHCLSIPELVHLICKEVGCDDSDSRQSSTGPAVDVLWRDLDHIRPVLKCLPYNLLQHCPIPRSNRPSLGLGDLERPLIYSKRVRSLRVVLLERRCTASYAASLFMEMCALVPAHEIFPNLQHLQWSLDQYLSQDLYHLFVPTVTHLSLYPRFMSGVHGLRRGVPHELYAGLKVATISPHVYCPRHVSAFVQLLAQIENLGVSTLDPPALTHLSNLPRLEKLSLLDTKRIHADSQPLPFVGGFAALRHLTCDTLEFPTQFLNALHDSDLTRVKVITATPVTDTEAKAFFIALALHVAHGALEELCLLRETTTGDQPSSSAHDFQSDSDDGLEAQTLLCLVCFSNLRTIQVEVPVRFHVDDETMSALISSWPRLEALTFMSANQLRHLGKA
ncbi:hypothetical protein B0H14DRAFT_2725606 [Mycena olivaceomarginata]|nr:hypothetical protein B0H14DRAFT_2725606 [Mycena olivaceomarginata]